MNTTDEELARYRTVTFAEAEEIEEGCTEHTVRFLKSPTGVYYHAHARLGIKWEAEGL